MPNIIKSIHARNKKDWRAWLRKNHKKEKKVFLIKYKKHTGKPSITHKESMLEAICFGWIDFIILGIFMFYFRKLIKIGGTKLSIPNKFFRFYITIRNANTFQQSC